MSLIALLTLAIALAADAFAVALGQGVALRRPSPRQVLLLAGAFGGMQALMPIIGWAVGIRFERYVSSYAGWIAFGLLLVIGAKMVLEAVRGQDAAAEADALGDACRPRTAGPKPAVVFMLALATSIDALAVGVAFSVLEVDIAPAAAVIGLVAAALSAVGLYLGAAIGVRFARTAEIIGGVVLVAMGTRILLEQLGILG